MDKQANNAPTCKDCEHYCPLFVGGVEIGMCCLIEHARSYRVAEPHEDTVVVSPYDEICGYYEE